MSKMSFQGKGLINRPNAEGYIKFVDGKHVTSNKSDQDLLKKAGYKGKELSDSTKVKNPPKPKVKKPEKEKVK